MNEYLSLLFTCFILSCTATSEVTIDNPSNNEYKLTIDGAEEVFIEKNSTKTISLNYGKRNFKMANGESFSVYIKQSSIVLINPSLSEYFVETTKYYGRNDIQEVENDTLFLLNFRLINCGIKSIGKKYSYIDAYGIGLGQDAPSEILLSRKKASDLQNRPKKIRKLLRYNEVTDLVFKKMKEHRSVVS